MVRVLNVGHVVWDITFRLDEFPKENKKYLVDEVAESSGGPAANAASLLAKWGVPTALIAPLGADSQGASILRDLEQDGVVLDLLRLDPSYSTPFSTILINSGTGSRTILTHRPRRPAVDFDRAALERLAPRGSIEGLIFDGHEAEASSELIQRYPRAWSLLDAGTLRPGTQKLAREVTHLLASESFASAVIHAENPGKAFDLSRTDHRALALESLRRLSPLAWVGITLGESGCIWFDPVLSQRGALPALHAPAVDTTGAGDIFHGAFAFGLIRDGRPDSALVWATCAAGLSVQKSGGRNSIPTLDEARQMFDGWATPIVRW